MLLHFEHRFHLKYGRRGRWMNGKKMWNIATEMQLQFMCSDDQITVVLDSSIASQTEVMYRSTITNQSINQNLYLYRKSIIFTWSS